MKMNIIKNIILISMILLTASSAYCATDSEMEALAKEYFELDYKGARVLKSKDKEEIDKLEDGHFQGNWDCDTYCSPPAMVAGGYELDGVHEYKGKRYVEIIYYIIGVIYEPDFTELSRKDLVNGIFKIHETLHFTTVNGELKVDSDNVYPPRISIDAAREFFKKHNKIEDLVELEKAIKNFNKYKDLVME